MGKKYLVWVGQNATTGNPNPITGRMSTYGEVKIFRTAEDRNEYLQYCEGKKVTRRQARDLLAGWSLKLFNEHLELMPACDATGKEVY